MQAGRDKEKEKEQNRARLIHRDALKIARMHYSLLSNVVSLMYFVS